MSHQLLHSREAQQRIADAMTRLRDAWREVEQEVSRLGEAGPDERPNWVFALARKELDDIRAVDARLAAAEARRRRAAEALHCLVDLMALEALPGVNEVDWDPEAIAAGLSEEQERDWRSGLDRFIGIVHQAKRAGVIYANGTFLPIEVRDDAS